MVEQWEPLHHYFNEAANKDSPAFQKLADAFKLSHLKVYLMFLMYVLDIVCKMNVEFQSESSMIHLLHQKMSGLYRTILSNYMSKAYVSSKPIELINPVHITNYKLNLEDVYAGADAELLISNGHLTKPQEESFRRCILEYYSTLCREIRSRFDFTDPILREIHRINPSSLFGNTESDQSLIPLLRNFPWCKNVSRIEEEFRMLQNTDEAKQFLSREVDSFWYQVGKIKTGGGDLLFGNVSEFVQSVLCLPHSSAEVERIFSKLNNIKTKLRNRLNTSCYWHKIY